MKIVTSAEMRAIDRATSERYGVPSLTLMENAGRAVAEYALAHYSSVLKIAVFCGKGNNGGDGFVAARQLHEKGKTVEVILLADAAELKGDAAVMYGKLPVAPIVLHPNQIHSSQLHSGQVHSSLVPSSQELKTDRVQRALEADLYIDAILGTGFKPPMRGLYADAIAIINASKVSVIAVDIPSGADADAMSPQPAGQDEIVARADSIVTFTAPRPAHVFGSLTRGSTCVAGIGSPEQAIVSSLNLTVITARDFAGLIAPRPAESNKGNYGHVLVVGGSLGKAGAAAMAGMAVLRAGAGLSTVATPKSVLSTVAGFHPEVMTESLPETGAGTIAASAAKQLEELRKGKSVLAIGPGISRNAETADLVRSLVAQSGVPIVLDADGLNAFEGLAKELNGKGRVLVITPHPGEMARLAGCSIADVQKDRMGMARKFASEHGVTVVLKGHRTLVVQPDGEAWVNTTGNPGMATGGTGDILTGIVAAMLAQAIHAQTTGVQGTVSNTTATAQNQKNAMLAVCAAVHLHGLAGDIMRESVGEHSLVATDLLKGLPVAFDRAWRAAGEDLVYWNG